MGVTSVRDVDEKVWLEFAIYCKRHGKKLGPELSNVLDEFLQKNTGVGGKRK
jgi:hypothetical protein